jgi:CSLREA domain-containing protein
MMLNRVLRALPRISVATVMVALSAASAARASSTIVDLGASVLPVAVNAHQQVLSYNGSVWSNGTVITPQAPSSAPTAQFPPAPDQYGTQINDSGVVVGEALTVSGATETVVPAYWNTASSSFTVVSLAGLMVNSQPATGGFFEAIDAAGDAVGVVYNSSGSAGDVSANTAGLLVAGNDAMPTGASQVLASVDGTAIHSLDGVSAGYEDANASQSDIYPEVLIDRQTQTATTTNLYPIEGGPIGFADNGTLSGAVVGPGVTPTVRTASGSETSLSETTGESGPATDVNASGTAIGFVYNETGPAVETGLIWSSSGTESDLLSDVSNPGSWSQLQPEAINDEGYVVGTGQLNGVEHGFLISTARVVPPVVTSTGDAPAANPSSGSCDTGHTVANALGQPVPECTLRAAIQIVNAIGTSGQQITFDIPGTAPGAIQLGSLLPAVTAAGTEIDGASQPSGPVQILGPGESSAAPSGAAGCLDVQASDVLIEGFDLGNCQVGIELQSPGQDEVQDDMIGLALDGETPTPCNDGVWISSAADDTIGGASTYDRNVISGDGTGVLISGSSSTGDKVQGNLIGTDSSGAAFVPDTYGVEVLDASDDTIGAAGIAVASAGTPPGNVIDAAAGTTANFAVAVLGVSTLATDDVVGGNLVGTDASGSRIDLSGTSNAGPALGVALAGHVFRDTVGGGNVIAGATSAEVAVDSVQADDNTISGDQIGSSRSGKVALPSTSARGILVAGGLATTIANNAVTGQEFGISIQGHTVSFPAPAGGTVPGTSGATGITHASVSGNVVGPLPSGTSVPVGAQQWGILDSGGTADVIGPNNQVSWNRVGVDLSKVTVADLKGNLVGTNRAGTVALPDGLGMLISQSQGVDVGAVGHPDTISGSTGNLMILDSDHVSVRAELIGTTKLGNAALTRFSRKLPWGDILGQPTSLGGKAFVLDDRVGIDIVGGGSPSRPTLIGGSKPGQGVVVSGITGSKSAAIELQGPTLVDRDKIGVGRNGTSAVPNGGIGVSVYEHDASDSKIVRSTIAHNHDAGVVVTHADKVLVLESPVFDNHTGGIKANDGTFGNAPFPPTLGSASDVKLTRGGKKFARIRVVVDVDVPGSQQGEVQFFATPTCQAGGAGQKYLGRLNVSGGHHKTRVLLRALQAVGTAITATISTTGNGTSRFSNCVILAPAT